MCQFASLKGNPDEQVGYDIAVADLFSHGNTEKLTGKTEATG